MLSRICCSMLTPQLIQNSSNFSVDIYKSFSMLKNPVKILLLISVYVLSCNIIFFVVLAFFENRGILGVKIQWERVKIATCFFCLVGFFFFFPCENCCF